jgi:hypothetical protein
MNDHPIITAETLKRWGCQAWSTEERQELARIANDLGLVEPTSCSVWPELAAAFRDNLG